MNDQPGQTEPGPPEHPDGPTITAASRPPIDFPDARIGRYKILDQLGEGGMGVVYLAEQTEPVRRQVAVKVIKLGMDTRQVIARFEAERQALALMDHPNIARVLDAGATDTGRPYFVMQLVRGRPITDYCDVNRLDTGQRIELLRPVCQAIQHAHHKGVIHRDIKPSNVLVRMRDGHPVPTVIDFGIAKAIHQPLGERTLVTQVQQFVGTPAYMSPEQAERSGIDIDTRTDVYSLGVLLYELLTGRPPFDPERLRTAGFDEAARIIRDEDARRPSTRLSGAGEDTGTLAERRRTTPAALERAVRGDLDWIVMKAIEKDRTRRYDTPLELAADLARHLRGEPVLAGPPTVRYRLGKHVKRYRVPIAVGAAAVAVLAAAFVLTAVKWRDAVTARHGEVEQRLIAEEAVRQAKSALIEAEQQRHAAEAEASQNAAVVGFLQRMLALANPTGAGDITAPTGDTPAAPLQRELAPLEITLAQVLQHAGRHVVPSVAHEPKVEGTVRYILGTTFADIGLDFQAEHNLYTAYRLRRQELGDDHPATLRALAKLGQRLRHAAHAQYMLSKASDGMVRVLGPDHPETLVARSWYAERLLQSNQWHPRALEVLGDTLTRQSSIVGPQHPQTLWTKRLTAEALWLNGRTDESISLGLSAWRDAERAGLSYIAANLHLGFAGAKARVYNGEAEQAEVLDHIDRGVVAAEAAFGRQSYPYVLAVVDAAVALENADRADLAVALYRDNIRNWAMGTSGTDDRLPEWHRNLERLLERQGDDAADVRNQRLAVLEELARRGGAEAANAWRTEGYIRETSLRLADAGEAYDRALTISRDLWPDEDRLEIAWALQGLGNARWAEGDFDAAERLFRESFELRTRLYGPQATETLILLQSLPKLLAERGKTEEALVLTQRLCDGIAPRREFCGPQYADALLQLTMVQIERGMIGEADTTSAQLAVVAGEHLPDQRAFMLIVGAARGAVDARLGRYAEAEPRLLAGANVLAWSAAFDPSRRREHRWVVSQTAEMYRLWSQADPTPQRQQAAQHWAKVEASLSNAAEESDPVTPRPTRS